MLDFLRIAVGSPKKDITEIYPKFVIRRSSDLMIRGADFYAIWVEEQGVWSTDEQDVIRLVDNELRKYYDEHKSEYEGQEVRIKYMWDSDSGAIDRWHKYCQKQMRDNFNNLDEKLVFSNTEVKKEDYATKRLNYPLESGSITAWDKLISTLYTKEERHKIEWAIGSIVSGASKTLQKFLVFYGGPGTGKSTIMKVIEKLFSGYYTVFDAKSIGSSNSQFALEQFKGNPLVAIQHDGDLSTIQDNTRLNSIVSHEELQVNEKFKGTYKTFFKCMLFMGTNKPVKITDAKSGLIRRLIDVSPSGNKLNAQEYRTVMNQIEFELGAIAHHCRDIFTSNPEYYDAYIPLTMMGATNDFYNYIIDYYHVFEKEDGTSLKAAWEMYKVYIDEAKVPYPLAKRNFKEELRNYFKEYKERHTLDDGTRVRSYYSVFLKEQFEESNVKESEEMPYTQPLIKFDSTESIFDKKYVDSFAQYANNNGTPIKKWEQVTTKLSELDTNKLHYVKVPDNHIVIDFDLKDDSGNKNLELNVKEASKWPETYAELSKSGCGVHLHYIYNGDPSKLSRIYDENIEVKVFAGNSSLRRKLTKCNDLPIATISSGLPLKGDDKMINFTAIKSEKALRTLIKRHLNKEIMGATKPSIDMIHKILEEAYAGNVSYDISDMHNDIVAFALSSTNQAEYCIKLVNKMKFKAEEPSLPDEYEEAPIAFYDVEVFPNLFLVNWKVQGEQHPVVRMINPKPTDIEMLLNYNLVGFNCRRYDNHILYARLMGYTNEQLFDLSQKIVGSKKNAGNNCFFGEAYNISYTDVFDFSTKKQSLKKWEIELGLHHKELGLPWDKPVPEEKWLEVAEYCDNDVIATEAVFNHLKGDFLARQILADLAGGTVNDTTNSLTTKIIFGKERRPKLVYTDLATGEPTDERYRRTDIITSFPGYEFVSGKNMYRGDDVGKGGYVYAEPGMHSNVALLDVASMHPSSIIAMDCFGEYTSRFKDILDARIAIKHKDFETARNMLDGKLAKYLDDENAAGDLAQALKIAINSVYGLTSASFDNPFRDLRNKNNIVALRGALFMRTLQDEVQSRGFTVAHIKTDSIKIPNATPEIIEFVMEFGKQYGYTFEHEDTYAKMCLVNDAVYIAKYEKPIINKKTGKKKWWTATGTQFAVPYVFKTLFSKEPIEFEDKCETKSVTSALYLDMNESISEDEHNYQFVGRVGQFCPMKPGTGGGWLVREGTDKEGNIKYSSATGAKGYRWLESETVKQLEKEIDIDLSYYDKLVDGAIETISKYGDFEWFIADDSEDECEPPCGNGSCEECNELNRDPFHLDCNKDYDISDILNNLEDESEIL